MLKQLFHENYVHVHPSFEWETKIKAAWGAGGHQLRGQNPINGSAKEVIRCVLLRDPVERYISFYRHIKNSPDHHIAVLPGVKEMNALQLARYLLEIGSHEFSNLQSKLVYGSYTLPVEKEVVLDALNSYRFHAPVEFISIFWKRLCAFAGSATTPVETRNVSHWTGEVCDDYEALASIVYSHNEYDLELYNYSRRELIDSLTSYFNLYSNPTTPSPTQGRHVG